MGKKQSLITVDNISGVVNESFGFWRPAQIILHERKIEGDYKALTDYLVRKLDMSDTDEQSVSLHRLQLASQDLSLSEEGRQAALQVWSDLNHVRMLTENAGVYLQGGQARNASTDWHYHGVGIERTVLCKYSGNATEISKEKDVTSWGQEDPDRSFVVCDVAEDAELITFNNGDMFAIAGGARFFGMPVVHRKPIPDGEPSLALIAEPDL